MAYEIHVFSRTVYGRDLVYPLPGSLAEEVTRMTGRATLAEVDLEALQALGHTIEFCVDPRHAEQQRAMMMRRARDCDAPPQECGEGFVHLDPSASLLNEKHFGGRGD